MPPLWIGLCEIERSDNSDNGDNGAAIVADVMRRGLKGRFVAVALLLLPYGFATKQQKQLTLSKQTKNKEQNTLEEYSALCYLSD